MNYRVNCNVTVTIRIIVSYLCAICHHVTNAFGVIFVLYRGVGNVMSDLTTRCLDNCNEQGRCRNAHRHYATNGEVRVFRRLFTITTRQTRRVNGSSGLGTRECIIVVGKGGFTSGVFLTGGLRNAY